MGRLKGCFFMLYLLVSSYGALDNDGLGGWRFRLDAVCWKMGEIDRCGGFRLEICMGVSR